MTQPTNRLFYDYLDKARVDREGYLYTGMHQQGHSQQVEGRQWPLLGAGEAVSEVLHLVLVFTVYEIGWQTGNLAGGPLSWSGGWSTCEWGIWACSAWRRGLRKSNAVRDYREDRDKLFLHMHSKRTRSGQKLGQVIFQLDMSGEQNPQPW